MFWVTGLSCKYFIPSCGVACVVYTRPTFPVTDLNSAAYHRWTEDGGGRGGSVHCDATGEEI